LTTTAVFWDRMESKLEADVTRESGVVIGFKADEVPFAAEAPAAACVTEASRLAADGLFEPFD
jgi:hypothetical protein